MSVAAAAPAAASGVRPLAGLDRLAPAVLVGVALSVALSWPLAMDVWATDRFADTDDAMRLVQVRDWLAGQGWFDLVAHRLAPPAGLPMHWSRVVDVPVGALIRLFELGLDEPRAERLARIAFPLAMQVALLTVGTGLARLLLGPRGGLAGAGLLVLGGFMFGQFPPGRIDHHAPQVVLVVGIAWALLASLRPGRSALAAVAAAGMGLSLAISLETLPFLALLCAVLPLAWVHDPGAARRPLAWLACGLTAALPALFAITVPPGRWLVPVGDAFSVAHLAAGLAGAGALALLPAAGDPLPGWGGRLSAVAGAGAAVLLLAVLAFPHCFRDPYAGLDPVLAKLWLANVTEAQPLLAAARLRPATVTMLFCPLALGTCAAGAALAFARSAEERLRWGAVLALAAVGTAGTFWEIRVASTAQPFAALGGAWAVTGVLSAARRGPGPAGLLAAAAALPFSAIAWAFVPAGEGDPVAAAALAAGRACRTREALAPLARLSPGLVLAPIDDGAHLLVYTAHGVLAAPYHRNGAGNRAVVDAFLAAPDRAAALVRRTGARYLALCPGEVGVAALAAAAPGGLAARLAAGAVPPWLEPLDLPGTPYRVFGLEPAADDETVM